jgi:PAS domain S-box-containing protein
MSMVNIINLHNYVPIAFNWRYGSMLVILSAALAGLFLLVSLWIVFHFRKDRKAEEIREAQARQAAVRADVSASLTRSTSSKGFLQESAQAIVTHLDGAFARIWVLNRQRNVLELHASAGMYTGLDGPHSSIPVGKLKIGTIAQTKKPCLINNVLDDPAISDKEWARRERIVSFIGYPLIAKDLVVGVMAMFSRHWLSDATLDTLSSIADALAQGIEREQAEEKVRQSEAYLAEAQKLSHTGSFGWKVETGEIIWSDETYRILGLDRTVTPALDLVLQRVHAEDVERVQRVLDHAANAQADFDIEHRLSMPDGSTKHIHVVARAVSNLGKLEFVGAVMDITDRKHADLELRESERNLRLLIDAIPGMVGVNSARGENEYCSKPILDYTGKTMDDMAGVGWASVFHPDDIDHVMRTWLECMETGEPHVVEFRLRCWDGSYRWFQSRSEPLRDEEGRILRWYTLIYDIDDRKNTEEALRAIQIELAHVSRVTTLGELVASIAHEVNQPLGAIVTNGEACIRLLSREEPDLIKSRDVVRRMIDDGIRAGEVIKRIRSLIQKTAVERSPVDVNDAINEVMSLVSGELRRSEVRLKTDLAGQLPPIIGDRVQLQQVILNLVLNAKDAMTSPQCQRRELTIQSSDSGHGQVIVAVQDSGCGIEPLLAQKMFDPFFSTKPEGVGLGLSISRTIIEAHGGKLWATQNRDQGVTIQFALSCEGSES